MRKTILTHFYNEEYLLPWWLNYHKDKFDWGVCINYGSSDRSVEIIKDLCPKWAVVDSINDMFDAKRCDEEVVKYERQIPGWKVTLNVTEFLVGNYSVLDDTPEQELIIPCNVMVDINETEEVDVGRPLVEQRYYGIHFKDGNTRLRRPRCIHNKKQIQYPLGRHYETHNCEDLQVCWYGWSPFSSSLIKRKLQIQTKIPDSDRVQGFGREHITDINQLIKDFAELKTRTRDLSKELMLKTV